MYHDLLCKANVKMVTFIMIYMKWTWKLPWSKFWSNVATIFFFRKIVHNYMGQIFFIDPREIIFFQQ